MKRGHLSEYFDGVAGKKLSAVESDTSRSNQHEFQAIRSMVNFMGKPTDRIPLPARFIYLTDDDPDPIVEDAYLTLYDARRNKPRSPEYRFYFPSNAVMDCAAEGDLLVIAKRRNGGMLVIIAEGGSSIASQVEWLFGLTDVALPGFSVRAELENAQDRIEFASTFILDAIGVEVEAADDNYLDRILTRFGEKWPKSKELSVLARELVGEVDSENDPDTTLMAWVEKEYVLFRTLERHTVSEKLDSGFHGEDGIEDFLQFSLSVQNRRKSRSGLSFENHLEELIRARDLPYMRNAKTEGKSKPDFLFPGEREYQDPDFPVQSLFMLGAKTSAKERWRQVLAEAERIEVKHLITMEAAISINQTDEMTRNNVRLIVPIPLQQTYAPAQLNDLLSLRAFLDMISNKLVLGVDS